MTLPVLIFGDGLLNSVAQIAVIAGTLVLMMTLLGFGAYAYKHVTNDDGIEWPDDKENLDAGSDDGVSRGGKDDEWKYY